MLVWPPSFKENICSVVLSHDVAECIIDKNMHKSKFSIQVWNMEEIKLYMAMCNLVLVTLIGQVIYVA